MSKESWLSVPNESESVESEKNFDNDRIEKIEKYFKELKDRLLKSKINEIRNNLYEIESKKNFCKPKIKNIENNFLELKKVV